MNIKDKNKTFPAAVIALLGLVYLAHGITAVMTQEYKTTIRLSGVHELYGQAAVIAGYSQFLFAMFYFVVAAAILEAPRKPCIAIGATSLLGALATGYISLNY